MCEAAAMLAGPCPAVDEIDAVSAQSEHAVSCAAAAPLPPAQSEHVASPTLELVPAAQASHAPWVASCLPSGLPCTGGGIHTLHLDLRTRQQHAVYNTITDKILREAMEEKGTDARAVDGLAAAGKLDEGDADIDGALLPSTRLAVRGLRMGADATAGIKQMTPHVNV